MSALLEMSACLRLGCEDSDDSGLCHEMSIHTEASDNVNSCRSIFVPTKPARFVCKGLSLCVYLCVYLYVFVYLCVCADC